MIFAFIAAASVALMTAFNHGEKSNKLSNCVALLNVSIIKSNQDFGEKNNVIYACTKRGNAYRGSDLSTNKISLNV